MSTIRDNIQDFSPRGLEWLSAVTGIDAAKLKRNLDIIANDASSSIDAEHKLATMFDGLFEGAPDFPAVRAVHASHKAIKQAGLTSAQEEIAKNNAAGSIPDVLLLKGTGGTSEDGKPNPQIEVVRLEVKYTQDKFQSWPTASAPSSAYDAYVLFEHQKAGALGETYVITSADAIKIKRGVKKTRREPGDYDLEQVINAAQAGGGKISRRDMKKLSTPYLGRALQAAIIARLKRASRDQEAVKDIPPGKMTIPGLRIDGSKVRIDLKFEQRLRRFVQHVLTEEKKRGIK